MTEQKTEKTAAEQRDDALKASYQKAMKRLREAHLDEFNSLRVEEAQKLGYEWTPPKTEEQKAKEKYDALIAEFPHLASGTYAAQVPGVSNEPIPSPVDPVGTGEGGATRI